MKRSDAGRDRSTECLFTGLKKKVKCIPVQALRLCTGPTAHRGNSYTLSLPRHWKGASGKRHARADLAPGKTRYPLYRRLGGPQGRSTQVRKISPPTGIRSPDRPVHNQSLYRLRYPAPLQALPQCHWGLLLLQFYAAFYGMRSTFYAASYSKRAQMSGQQYRMSVEKYMESVIP